MTTQRKNELIYIALAFLTSLGQLTWIQIAYNDPSMLNALEGKSLITLLCISSIFVLTQTLIAWKAFLSNPDAPLPPPIEPPKPEVKP